MCNDVQMSWQATGASNGNDQAWASEEALTQAAVSRDLQQHGCVITSTTPAAESRRLYPVQQFNSLELLTLGIS